MTMLLCVPSRAGRWLAGLACAATMMPIYAQDAAPAPATSPGAATSARSIPIENFFNNEQLGASQLSPDARHLAIAYTPDAGRTLLATMDVATQALTVVASFADADIGHFRWVNEERLVFDVTDRAVGQGDVRDGPGLYAVDRDGKQFRQLATRNRIVGDNRTRLLPRNARLLQSVGDQDSDEVYVTEPEGRGPGDLEYVNLLKLNTRTGHATFVKRPEGAVWWLLDQTGEPRVVQARVGKNRVIYYRAPGTEDWSKLAEFDLYTGAKGAFTPDFFGPTGTLYVRARRQDKAALYAYDLAGRQVGAKAVFAIDHYDFSGVPIVADHKLLGIRYQGDSVLTWWNDDNMKAIQRVVDQRLPSTYNSIAVARRAQTPIVVVTAWSDVQPGMTLLFNTETQQLTPVGVAHPGIVAQQMSPKRLVHYTARDGLEIPAYLTLPQGSAGKNLPMVMLVHGGPYVRGASLNWNPEVQFLASRGYAVLEPEYRGSTGYGYKLFRAGWKQWGLKMQDDIADGAKWAIAQGYADAARICIAGASYGGYATLMGLINDPALYKCGVEWAGVTDINLIYDGNWSAVSDTSEEWKQYGMPVLVGDQVADAAQLKATSPLENAARIKQPLLLAYGGSDLRVPIYHGKKFYNAIKGGNPDVEWIEYAEEGHGWALPKNRIDFWTRVEAFLNRNIGH